MRERRSAGGSPRRLFLWDSTGLFLPEHRAALEELRRRQVPPLPDLAEDQREELERMVAWALDTGCPVILACATPSGLQEIRGWVIAADRDRRRLRVRGPQGEEREIPAAQVRQIRPA